MLKTHGSKNSRLDDLRLHDAIQLDDVQYHYTTCLTLEDGFETPWCPFLGDLEPSTAGGKAIVANVPVRRAYNDFRLSKRNPSTIQQKFIRFTWFTWSVSNLANKSNRPNQGCPPFPQKLKELRTARVHDYCGHVLLP